MNPVHRDLLHLKLPSLEPSQPSLLDSVHPSPHMDAPEPARDMCEKTDLKRKSPMGEKIALPSKRLTLSLPVEVKPSQIVESSGSRKPYHHGSPPFMDAVATVMEMYNTIYSVDQTYQLITFRNRFKNLIENQPQYINFDLEKEEWVANVRNVTVIAGKTLDIFYNEIGELSKSDPERCTEIVIRLLGQIHVALPFIALSIAAFAAKSCFKVPIKWNRSKDLLMKILELAGDVEQFCNVMPDEREKQRKAVGIIVEGAVHCYWYLKKGTPKKLWWAPRADALIQKINEQPGDVKQPMEEVRKQLPSRQPRSHEGLLESIPVGIEDQVEEVKGLVDMGGPETALAVNVCGLPLTGKSTLALAVVHSLCSSFSAAEPFTWSVVTVDQTTSNKNSHIMKLQNDIIRDFGGDCNCDLRHTRDGRQEIRKVLQNQKKSSSILLLIDNLVQKDDIGDLLPKDLQPGEGAKLRIIMTSNQKYVNEELNIICKDYEVKNLSSTHSETFLTEIIMKSPVLEENQVVRWDEQTYIRKVSVACNGFLPLLCAFGKYLRPRRNEQSYQIALQVLEEGDFSYFPEENLGEQVMVMYHEIKEVEVKDLFQDLCTTLHGKKWNEVASFVGIRKLEYLRMRMLVSESEEGEVIVPEVLRSMVKKWSKRTR